MAVNLLFFIVSNRVINILNDCLLALRIIFYVPLHLCDPFVSLTLTCLFKSSKKKNTEQSVACFGISNLKLWLQRCSFCKSIKTELNNTIRDRLNNSK